MLRTVAVFAALLGATEVLAAQPRVVDFDVASDGCGGWTATVHAEGSGHRLRVSTNGDVTAEWAVHGQETVTVDGRGRPNERLFLEARIGQRRAVRRTIHLPPFAASVVVSPKEAVVSEGKEARFDVHLDTLCSAETLRWDAVVRQTGAARSGAFLSTGDAWFVAPALEAGVYDVDVTVHGPEEMLARTSVIYRVERLQ
jgi:hypothetical protein